MRSPILLIALLFILNSTGLSFGYYDSINEGTPIPGLSPTAVALGSPKALSPIEPACVFTNPALTAWAGGTVQAAYSAITWTERVIESDIDKTVRTLTTLDNFSGAAVWPVGPVTLGAGYAKVAEFGYEGTHTVYDDPEDPEIGVEILYADGGQHEAMGSASMVLAGVLSAGFSGGMRTASADYEYFFNSHRYSIPDSSAVWSFDESEFAWHAGLALNGDLFKSGLSYSSGTEYMEESVSIGFSAYAEHLKKITVGFEGELISPFDSNRFLGKLSIIMPLTKNLNALTSASFDDQRVANRAGFGFGLGFSGRIGRFNLGGGILNRFRARTDTAFPDEEADRVDDSATQFTIGLSYSFSG